jgi:hypothetical protein
MMMQFDRVELATFARFLDKSITRQAQIRKKRDETEGTSPLAQLPTNGLTMSLSQVPCFGFPTMTRVGLFHHRGCGVVRVDTDAMNFGALGANEHG